MGFIPDHTIGLAGFFIGAWSFSRQISDEKARQNATVKGTATFSGEGQILNYAETGAMNYGDYQGQVTQNYIYDFTGPFQANVLFSDQRLFHQLDLKTGQVRVKHWCAPDQYDGHYQLYDRSKWSLVWKIVGPRKGSIISTTYHRLIS